MPRRPFPRLIAAGVLGCITFLLIGWSGLLVPSLIRSVKETFDQSDAGIGAFYFLYAVGYASGSFGGGLATERLGRRTVLASTATLHAIGLVALGVVPSWPLFLLAAVPTGLGSGALDGGVNGLFLDLFRTGRGRALNTLHLFFSLGALGAPLAVGMLVEAGAAWQSVVVATGVAAVGVAAAFASIAMPGGRRELATRADPTGTGAARTPRRLSAPLVLLGVAIACYVASEVGVSNWLVRFLEPAPLTVATTALALFWGGLTLGRLAGARIGDRFDHLAFAAVAAVVMSIALAAAILVPSLPLSIALFAVTGFASGPIFPMIIAIGGERYPDRSAAVSGLLAGTAVAGSVAYPPIIGFLSVTVGLTVAMLGNVLLGLACAAALVAVARPGHRAVRTAAERVAEPRTSGPTAR